MKSTSRDQSASMGEDSKRPNFSIFRRSEVPCLEDAGVMKRDALKPEAVEVLQKMGVAGCTTGVETRFMFGGAGLSLVYVWFKSGFPVALHAHDADCVYYITNGSIRLGTQDLGVGDGFFVSAGTPYSYTVGAEGVELLEFRNAETYDLQIPKTSKIYWDKVNTTIAQESAKWADEPRPAERVSSS